MSLVDPFPLPELVVYSNNTDENDDEKEEIAKRRQDQEILDAMELLELTYQADTKLINEDVFVTKPFKNHINKISNETIIELEETSPIRSKEGKETPKTKNNPLDIKTPSEPLSPAYHPSRKVSQVWSENHHVEYLYRYTNFDRLVYPPGYIRERESDRS